MANFLYKLLGMFSLTDEYDDDDEDFDDDDAYDEDEEEETPRFRLKKSKEKSKSFDDDDDDDVPVSRPEKKSNILQYNKKNTKSSSGVSVCIINPTSFEDGVEISDTLLHGNIVALNLENVDSDVAQRIIDFTSGACYAIGGNLQKSSNYQFIVTPASVDISGEVQSQVRDAMMQSNNSSNYSMNQNRYRL